MPYVQDHDDDGPHRVDNSIVALAHAVNGMLAVPHTNEPLTTGRRGVRRKSLNPSLYLTPNLDRDVGFEKFALAIMNNAEPSASDVAAFENDLKGHKVKVMPYNAQASEPAVQRLVQIAKDEKIPVVGVSETEPADTSYQQWMTRQLDALDKALSSPAS